MVTREAVPANGASTHTATTPDPEPMAKVCPLWTDFDNNAVCDGGIDRNPGGVMYWSVALIDANGEVRAVERFGHPSADVYNGPSTNNVAEFLAALDAARLLEASGGEGRILTDSQVLARAVRRRRTAGRIPHLDAILHDLLAVLDRTGIVVEWHKRDLMVEMLGH